MLAGLLVGATAPVAGWGVATPLAMSPAAACVHIPLTRSATLATMQDDEPEVDAAPEVDEPATPAPPKGAETPPPDGFEWGPTF